MGFTSDSTGVRATLNHAERKEVDGNNKGYKRDAGYLKASHVADTFWVDFSLFHSKGRTDLQRAKEGSAPGLRNAKWSYDPTEMTLASIQATKAWSENQATTIRASYTESDAKLHQRKYNGQPTTYEKTEEKFYSIDLSHAAQFGIHSIRAGLSLLEWDNPTGMLFYPGFAVKERTHSAYLQDEFSLGNWSFDGGIRVDKRYLDKGSDEFVTGTPPTTKRIAFRDRSTDPLFAVSAGALYKFNDDLNATFRLLFTQQDPTSFATLDESLPKEKRMRYELGINKHWASFLTTKATFFWDHLSDAAYIASQYEDSDGVMHNIYAANSRDNKGLELMLLGSIQNFSYDFSYSHVKPGKIPTGTINTPTNIVKLHLSYASNNWSADLTSKYVDSYLSASHAATNYAGDFVTTDIQLGRVFNQSKNLSHKVMAYVKNVEDKKYETMSGFPDEGRSFGLTYQLNY